MGNHAADLYARRNSMSSGVLVGKWRLSSWVRLSLGWKRPPLGFGDSSVIVFVGVAGVLAFQGRRAPVGCGDASGALVKYGEAYFGLFIIFRTSVSLVGQVWSIDRCSPLQLAHLGWQDRTSGHFGDRGHWHEAVRRGSAQRAQVGGSSHCFAGQASEVLAVEALLWERDQLVHRVHLTVDNYGIGSVCRPVHYC